MGCNKIINKDIDAKNEELDICKHLEKLVENRTSELENSIKELREELIEHKKVENQLKSALKEKELLIQEVYHRVKNNMQTISSLLSLQAMNLEDKEAICLLQESQNRIKSMALVHENLYMSKDLSHIQMSKYVEKLVLTLSNSYSTSDNHIKTVLDIDDDIYMNIEFAIPCGIIINELMTNSLKYAFPDGRSGEVSVQLKDLGENYILIVSDDGVGLPENFNHKEKSTLGLLLLNNLVKQLDGELEINKCNKTEFKIRFRKLNETLKGIVQIKE